MKEQSILPFILTNIAIFVASLVLTLLFKKLFRNNMINRSVVFLFLSVLFAYSIKHISQSEESKYKTFGVKRCANKREITAQFRIWSRTKHPDQKSEEVDDGHTFESLDQIKDFLLTDHTRLFYDKFDQIFENDQFDEKRIKEIHSYLFQTKLFEYLNATFIWIFLSFLLSHFLKQYELTAFFLKVLMGKTFVLIYFLYSQSVDTCSIFDSVFEHITISKQIMYIEFCISFIFGFLAVYFYDSFKDEKERLIKSVEQAKQTLGQTKNEAAVVKDLKNVLEKFSKFLNE